jgi:hypothetical protein
MQREYRRCGGASVTTKYIYSKYLYRNMYQEVVVVLKEKTNRS